jgi:hypothetical protein
MDRRAILILLSPLGAWAQVSSLRGRLVPGSPARLDTGSGQTELAGDQPTLAVLADERLKGVDFEANGAVEGGRFQVLPIHKRNMFVHKGGKKLMISYWCSVCSIRTWSPGKCMCCQDETELDLAESFETVK